MKEKIKNSYLCGMSRLDRKIPPFIYSKSNLIWLVLFTAVFALLFINIYTPFESPSWYPISRIQYFLYSSLIILTGVLVVVISRIVMFYYTKKRTISYWDYILWVAAEIFFMSLFYTLYSYLMDDTRNFWEIYRSSVRNTSLILLLPYFISLLFFSMQEKSRQLKALEESKLPGEGTLSHKGEILSFTDDKGDLKLSIKKESLLFLESADNYVSVWYMSKSGVSKYLLRNTLKEMEDRFANTNIIRCHRSFMVNLDQVKIAKRTKDGIMLDLGVERIPDIPVSKSYGDRITQWFASLM